MLKHKRSSVFILVLLAAVVISGFGHVRAADTLQAVAESYRTSKPLQQGMIVQLDNKDKRAVAAASYNTAKNIFGVTVAPSETPVSLSSDTDEQQAYVVTGGRYSVLVSDQNGPVEKGDFIAVSAIDGIGMKADAGQPMVIGRAVAPFDGKTNVLSTTSLNKKDGTAARAAIGSVLVDVAVRANPVFNGNGGVPNFMQNLALSVVGKPINALQLYSSLAILFTGLGIAAALIYSGVQTSIASLGRNPLARRSIMRGMMQVIITGALIFLGCLIAVYLILNI
ncbi:MAG TPA: hypothetical protein VGE30_02010 [Candidatus Saccharimonadales bacterium]